MGTVTGCSGGERLHEVKAYRGVGALKPHGDWAQWPSMGRRAAATRVARAWDGRAESR
jgi:hypothetical protein